ncbi:erythroblast NAD(P)(+)--arginine ADP-ribosyltransferase [Coregonus clupeaformis]|uniref:erythroblast NAD(P)(+)--arginine ADP-ribosyltransferase n=1 Tax=Coregonus clupeaformis TaxID=59861 RepID=UPI001BE06A82|nr:erythroblast NAD(P)(+)--arginine ADP-ribosyltransferase [Coregonus clupeaformis]
MRRDHILTFAVLCVFHAWTLGVDSNMISPRLNRRNPGQIRLDMAPDSIDDSYDGCRKNMLCEVTKKFLPEEKNTDSKFKVAWDDAMTQYGNNYKSNIQQLSNDHLRAIHVYVNPQRMIYAQFNEATRTLGNSYKTDFKYHSLHFLLSDALRILNEAQGKQCVKSFRGAAVAYQGDKDDTMRFGQFTSSTTDELVAKIYANWKTCFKITTCYGASLADFSQVEAEKEVLIPPYEVFKIAKVTKNKVLEDKDKDIKSECEIVYELESTKTKSDRNCDIVEKDSTKKMCNTM